MKPRKEPDYICETCGKGMKTAAPFGLCPACERAEQKALAAYPLRRFVLLPNYRPRRSPLLASTRPEDRSPLQRCKVAIREAGLYFWCDKVEGGYSLKVCRHQRATSLPDAAIPKRLLNLLTGAADKTRSSNGWSRFHFLNKPGVLQ